uniref:NFACT-R_1 domain-containing protein n=1 Tax=Steinernema glaseri TaxID=37863 RepID=A0A1I8A147_9BILA
MKNRFSTLDVAASVNDLQSALGMRVVNVYDIDSKTYLIKLQKPDYKCVILFECGKRLHRTSFDWPKAQFPSSFSMKFRKHIKQKRLESIRQMGVDRVVDMQFGEDNRACHVIVELYDRGNIVLTDHNYIILNVLRPRTDKDNDVKFSVKERYPIDIARQFEDLPTREDLFEILSSAKKKDALKRVLSTKTPFGPPIVEHGLVKTGFPPNYQMTGERIDDAFIEKVQSSLLEAAKLTEQVRCSKKGFVIYKREKGQEEGEEMQKYEEYHPVLFEQYLKSEDKSLGFQEFELFGDAVDEFYSKIEEQKAQQRAIHAKNEALKKLDNVKKDHVKRVEALQKAQIDQEEKAERIFANIELVDRAIVVIQSAIANKLSWDDIDDMRKNAASQGDPVAQSISKMNLGSNMISLTLGDPADPEAEALEVDIDLSLTAYQNSRKYFTDKKAAFLKEQKTIESSQKALQSAQAKTKQTLDKVSQHVDSLVRQRKPMWFEKFFWFISSENYLVVGGRDAHQNELLVKRYLRPGDVYVHADVRGASSVVVRNKGARSEEPIPPKTLEEAGTMAICYSTAWEAKVVVNAWWVRHDQVSRTAPSGEYLSTGSFMIRGKKNYLPGSQMQMGFGLLFQLDEDSLERHKDERKVCASIAGSVCGSLSVDTEAEQDLLADEKEEEEEAGSDDSDSDQPEFPDIEIGLAATRISHDDQGEEYTILQLGPSTGKGGRRQPTAREQYLEKLRQEEEKTKAEERKKVAMGQADKPLTKRQKHKLDKIKKKYKDQDDEERAVRIELLASANKQKAVKGKRRQRQAEAAAEDAKLRFGPRPEKKGEKTEEKELAEEREEVEEDAAGEEGGAPEEDGPDEEEEGEKEDEEEKILNSLTWKPVEEDSILNVVAVVAPYQVMNGFKYKVKLTPGTGKRSKAVKTAMSLFQRDKLGTPAEQKLISALGAADDRLSVNIPGKVRVSAPELFRKKK